MKIINLTKNTVLADEAKMANTFFTRLIGLLTHSSLRKGEALILKPSNCIHSLFMRFTIDVVFVDKHSRVLKAINSLRPWCFTYIYFNATFAIELPAGTIQSTSTQEGDIISIS